MELIEFILEYFPDYHKRRKEYLDENQPIDKEIEGKGNFAHSWLFLQENFPEIIQNFFDRACRKQRINAVKAFFELDKTQLMEVPYIEKPDIDEI